MRWLLLFLIVLNAVVLFWFGQQQRPENSGADTPAESVVAGAPGIVLLSELPREKIRYKKTGPEKEAAPAPAPEAAIPGAEAAAPVAADAAPVQQQPVKPVDAQPDVAGQAEAVATPVDKNRCGFLGPFAEAITVRQVTGRLKRAGIEAKTYVESARIDPVYWVHLGPAASRAVALETLRKLHEARIDAFIVAEGSDLNAISLGFFTRKASAEAIQQQRIAQGYDAKLALKERQREQFWVVVAPQSWSLLDRPLITKLRGEYGEFTRRLRKCSVVASFTQFE